MEAPLSIVCQACRARWQKNHDEQGHAIIHSPIGYASVFVPSPHKWRLLDTARSYADLTALLNMIAIGSSFCIRLVAFTQVVGVARYMKTSEGVDVVHEHGACEGLSITMNAGKA